jgi:hypothetical protein
MTNTIAPRQVVSLITSSDSAQKLEGIRAALGYIKLWSDEAAKEQIAAFSREERLSLARLPRDLFRCMAIADAEEVSREAAFALVASSKSYNQYYRPYEQFEDLPALQHDSFIERLEALLSTHSVHVSVQSRLLYTGEDEKHYCVAAVCNIFHTMRFTVGGKPVRLQGLPQREEDFFYVQVQSPHADVIDSAAIEPSAEEKEVGVERKGMANLLIVKELYDSEKNGIRVRMVFNGMITGSYMKIEELPEKVLS